MKNNLSKYSKIYICAILIFIGILVCIFQFYNKKTEIAASLNNTSEELIISLYDTDGKSNITKLNLASREENTLVSNRAVYLSGNLSEDKNSLIYMDAIGDEPWQVFLLNLKDNKNYKVTTDKVGKFGGKAGTKNIIYFCTLDRSSGLSKIAEINTQEKSSQIFDIEDKDRSIQVYDAKNNKIIAVTLSNSEDNIRQEEANKTKTDIKPIEYTIYEMNGDGSNMKKVSSVNAYSIDSIAYNYDCSKAIIYGKDINNEKGYGIYELSIDTGKITTLLTDNIIHNENNSIVSEIGSNAFSVISKNENLLYFTGRPKDSQELHFSDTTSYPQEIYSYNLSTHEIQEVYKYKTPTLITDLTISY